MPQLTQQLKSGKMEIVEVPVPQLHPGHVLVRNHFSVISAGTEGKTVSDARKGYIAKARSRQKEVRQVIDLIRSHGLKTAYNTVMNKLEALSPLGYSCSGQVLAVAEDVTDIKAGDFVACGGNDASHADFVAVPKNLCVRLESAVPLQEAAFITVASIALQGIRQAEVQLGGKCVVIGLGLIGILTMKLLKASGIRSLGIDIDTRAVERAKEQFGFTALNRDMPELTGHILDWSRGIGSDAVIITAGSADTDPVDLAGELCRHKGKVIIVGSVPTGFERKNYYRKELDLRMSCSYGPGRYDTLYEDHGMDYPAGYVRWTERRNMQSIAEMLSLTSISFSDIISHTFPLKNAPDAYKLILEKKEPYLGLLIQYDTGQKPLEAVRSGNTRKHTPDPCIGVIGAGSFAHNIMLPLLKRRTQLYGISTSKGIGAVSAARNYGFELATTNPQLIIKDQSIDTVFIFTRHHLHARQTIDALKAGKHVFVEKPIAITPDELEEIRSVYTSLSSPVLLMTGFNRRFAPAIRELKKILNPDLPKAINMRINAGTLPPGHWIHDPHTGGGRIIGEACHFIDLAVFLAGAKVRSLFAAMLNDPRSTNNTAAITLYFENGSIGNISYFSNGNKKIPKELIEIFCGQTVARIDDFRSLEVYSEKRKKVIHYRKSDKGHKAEAEAFIEAVKIGTDSPIPFDDIFHSMQVTFLVNTSVREGRAVSL
jgi:predicted dehydrogenase/threonine dehydrogenase-like Zn-dependent dehydrogenase